MGIGFSHNIPYKIRKQIAPTIFTSTAADSTTFTSATMGDNYALTLLCSAGTLAFAVGVSASSTVGNQLAAGADATFMVSKNSANPTGLLSLFGLTTTAVWQATVYE